MTVYLEGKILQQRGYDFSPFHAIAPGVFFYQEDWITVSI
jgi:hypothetical protein